LEDIRHDQHSNSSRQSRRSPEIKRFDSGKRVARFSLAINTYNKDQGRNRITCGLWDDAVERLTRCSVKKGTRIAVTGSLVMNEYTRTVGDTQIDERKIYVKVSRFQVLTPKGELVEPAEDSPPAPPIKKPGETAENSPGEEADDTPEITQAKAQRRAS
jgi:single-stranded DNA-binding protein